MAWIAAAPAMGYLFSAVWARQMEGRSKLPFVFVTWLIARGLFIFTPLVQNASQFVFLVAITPLIFSVSNPAYAAIMKEVYPDAQRGRLMSWARVLMSGMTLLAALVMGRLMDIGLDFRWAFAVGGVFGAASAAAFSRVPVPTSSEEPETRISTMEYVRDTLGILRRNPGYRWYTFSVFIYGFGNIITTTLMPMHQVDRFHITNTQVANLQNITSVMTILAFFYWGSFVDRRGPLLTVLLCLVVILTVPITYILATDVRQLYFAAAATGVANAGIDLGYLNTTLLFAEPGRASQYQALHSSFFGLRGSIAPFCAVPLLTSFGPRTAFFSAMCIMMTGTVVQLLAMRDYRQGNAHSSAG